MFCRKILNRGSQVRILLGALSSAATSQLSAVRLPSSLARRLYCNHGGQRFSERQGSLMEHTKLPKETVVRIIKCLGQPLQVIELDELHGRVDQPQQACPDTHTCDKVTLSVREGLGRRAASAPSHTGARCVIRGLTMTCLAGAALGALPPKA